MKKTAKLLSILLCAVMLLSATPVFFGAIDTESEDISDLLNPTPPTVATPAPMTSAAVKLNSVKNSAAGITVSWSAKKGAENYSIFRKLKGKTTRIATVSGTKTSYTDTKAKSNKKYTYSVQAFQGKTATKISKGITVLCVGTPKLKGTNKASSIALSWNKPAGATKYTVLIKRSSAKKFNTLYKGNKTTAEAKNLSSGVSYDFKIKAQINKTQGAYSKVFTQIFLEKPSLHAEEYIDMDGITLEWNKVPKAKGYYIYRSLKSKNDYKKIKTITDGSKEIYVDTTCKSINIYKYYIVAYNGSTKSAKSNVSSDIYGYYEDDNTPMYMTISKGETIKEVSKKLKDYGALGMVTWSNSNPKVLKITKSGVITGLKKGTSKVTIKGSYNDKNRKATIYVTVK